MEEVQAISGIAQTYIKKYTVDRVYAAEDGKKKVDMRIAQKAIDMHMKMRTSDDKLKFQNSIAKSYKDLLNTVKGK